MFGKVLEFARYYVKTKFGITAEWYICSRERPLHGPGQGNKAGPTMYNCISTKGMAVVKRHHEGAVFVSPDQRKSSARAQDAFVDDITSWLNALLAELTHFSTHGYSQGASVRFLRKVLYGIQALSQKWERVLWSTGGKLNLSKCFYYLVNWRFDEKGRPFLANGNYLALHGIPPLRLQDSSSGIRQALSFKECWEPHRTLGVIIAADRKQAGERRRLTKKSRVHASTLRIAKFTAQHAMRYYQAIYGRGMAYSLPATSLTEKELHKIQSPFTRQLLHRLRYPNSFPSALVYAPTWYGGLGLLMLYAVQGAEKCLLLLRHIRMGHGVLAETLEIALNWMHLFAGTERHPLDDVYTELPHLPDGWLSHLRQFLAECGASFWLHPSLIRPIKPRRDFDRVLADDICRSGLSKTTVEQLNLVRIYLRVETLSDLCTIQGDRIFSPSLDFNKAFTLGRSPILWPIQAKPSEKYFVKWRRFIRRTYCTSVRSNKLRQKLGRWLHNHHAFEWPTYFDNLLHCIYIRRPEHWEVRLVTPTRSILYPGKISDSIFCTESELPSNAVPASIHAEGMFCDIPDPRYDYPPPRPVPPPPTSFASYIRQLPSWEVQLLESFKEVDSTNPSLIYYLRSPTGLRQLFIGSDGGAIPNGPFQHTGSQAFVIATKNRVLWRGYGPVIGWPQNPSFRTETYGMLALLRLLWHLYIFWQVPIPKGTLSPTTDSQSLIDILTSTSSFHHHWYSMVFQWHHVDVLHQLVFTMKSLTPLQFTPEYVPGHQDDKKSWNELTRPEQVNVMADRAASYCLSQQILCPRLEQPAFEPIPSVRCYLRVDHHFVTSHEKKILLWRISEKNALSHYKEKYHWSRHSVQAIDWDTFGKTVARLPHLKWFIPKWSASWLPTFSILNLREGVPAECLLCNKEETNDHLWSCQCRIGSRLNFFRRFTRLLIDTHTSPVIMWEMVAGLKWWIDTTNGIHNDFTPGTLAAREQQRIGWQHLFRGWLSSNWQRQQSEYEVMNPRPTPVKLKKKTTTRTTNQKSRQSRRGQPLQERAYSIHSRVQTNYGDNDDTETQPSAYSRIAWNVQVTKFLISSSHESWVDRCEMAHHRTASHETDFQRTRADTMLKAMYAHAENVSPLDKKLLFGTPLEERQQNSANAIIQWCETILPAVRTAVREYRSIKSLQGESTEVDDDLARIRRLPARTRRRKARKGTYTMQHARQHGHNTRLKRVQRNPRLRASHSLPPRLRDPTHAQGSVPSRQKPRTRTATRSMSDTEQVSDHPT